MAPNIVNPPIIIGGIVYDYVTSLQNYEDDITLNKSIYFNNICQEFIVSYTDQYGFGEWSVTRLNPVQSNEYNELLQLMQI